MISRCYIHNFRCLENFELPIAGKSSVLLIGKNGAGKSAIRGALSVFQNIGRGANRVGRLVQHGDFGWGRTHTPMRFELEAELDGRRYAYVLAFEDPAGFREPRVFEEKLSVDGVACFTRELSQVTLASHGSGAKFLVDWHLVALPVIQQHSERDPIAIFKRWLERMLILAPIPALMSGESSERAVDPLSSVENFGEWFSSLLAESPAAYTTIDACLREVLPDLSNILNPQTGSASRSLSVEFRAAGAAPMRLPFSALSDGEKCFFVGALVVASVEFRGPLLCFWDEPDTHLTMSEVRHFVMALRRTFAKGGQIIVSSHDAEAMRAFADEDTFLLSRASHLDPTQIRALDTFTDRRHDLIEMLLRGEQPQ